jgi:hypothetical protein
MGHCWAKPRQPPNLEMPWPVKVPRRHISDINVIWPQPLFFEIQYWNRWD